MQSFVERHAKDVIGVLSGFDRLVFRGAIRQLSFVDGMMVYLAVARVLLKDFGKHAHSISQKLKESVTEAIRRQGRPVIYLASSATSKEDLARSIAARDDIRAGTICLLSAVEMCQSFEVYRNKETQRLELQGRRRKCLFFYHYMMHPILGLMHARIQSWFPFRMQVCINGREWLARQLQRARIDYEQRDNCFPWVADVRRAQNLLDAQPRTDWAKLLNQLTHVLDPGAVLGDFRASYYWTVYQSEWASDILFRDSASLARIYPDLVHHGVRSFGSTDVLRFLGRKLTANGQIHGSFAGEVRSDLKRRPEGVRLKHSVNGNSIKMYDKQGSVLRIETTINHAGDFKVFRPRQSDPNGRCEWQPMRQGIADLHRRTVVSQAANQRYAEALAVVADTTPLSKLLARLSRATVINGQRVRALRAWDPQDLALLHAINQGQFAVNGLRNRDLCRLLYPKATKSSIERQRRSSRISRQLRLLRAHGLLRKVARTHRYQLTPFASKAITAILAAHDANIEQLMKIAA